MQGVIYPTVGALKKAGVVKAALANCKVRLFKSDLVADTDTTKAALVAAEADFDGYPAGGKTIVAFQNPLLDPAGGASIESGTVQFEWTHVAADVGNMIGGFWIETAAGDLYLIGGFPDVIPMQGAGQGIPLSIKLREGRPLLA